MLKSAIQSLKEKGMEGGCEWYRFLGGEEMQDHENVESLTVNGEYMTDEDKIRESIENF